MKKINWVDVFINCVPLWIAVSIASYFGASFWVRLFVMLLTAVVWLFGRAAFEVWKENRQ